MMHSLVMRDRCAAGLYFSRQSAICPASHQVIQLEKLVGLTLSDKPHNGNYHISRSASETYQRSGSYSIVSYSTVVIGLWSLLLLGAYAAYDMPTILFRSNSTRIILNQCMWLRLWGDYWDYPWQNMKIFRFLTHFLLRIWWYQSKFRNPNFYP